ncbi:MAG: hypothetical protein RRC07_14320 [Anaerolineae bacterium]|nr:hypothetical protein [Anaerolineae bacterium]
MATMYTEERLQIEGYDSRPVPNLFFGQEEGTTRLAVLLPGYAYTADMPLLYYTTTLFLENGYDLLQVQYNYQRQAAFRVPVDEASRQWLLADVRAAVTQALAQGAYESVVVVGRSLGTLAMGDLLETGGLPATTRRVWQSPLFKDQRLSEQICRHRPRSLFITGTADAHYQSPLREQVREAVPREWLVLPDARHDLEIAGSIPRTLAVMEEVICATARFTGCAGCD